MSGQDNYVLDELRIGSIDSAVTIPEPTTLVLLMATTIGGVSSEADQIRARACSGSKRRVVRKGLR